MPDLILYGHPVSANTHRVRLLLSILKLPFEERTVDLLKGEQHGAQFSALTEFKRVPVLTNGELVLTESYAIMGYLARALGGEAGEEMYPTGYVRQALVNRWLFYCANELHNGIGLARNEIGFGIPSGGAYALGRAQASLKLLDAHLTHRTWIAMDQLTLADVAIYPFVAVAPEIGLDLAAWPAVSAWIERLKGLDGFIPMPRLLPDRAPA